MLRSRLALPLLVLATACGGPAATIVTTPSPDAGTNTGARRNRALQAIVDSIGGAPLWASAQWGVLIVDPQSGDTLAERNSGKLFMPASNQKVLTAALALATMEPDFRWQTTVAATGAVSGGTLKGDLVVIGRGDPTWSQATWGDAGAPLRALADSIAARGVRRIEGQVRTDGSAFPGSPIGFGWDWDDLMLPFGAGVGALLWNDGAAAVRLVACGKPEACVSGAPFGDVPRIRGTVLVKDDAPRGGDGVRWWRDSSPQFTLVVDGAIGPKDSVTIEFAQRHPTEAFREALVAALAERGVTVDGKGGRGGTRRTLFTWRSRTTLGGSLAHMLKASQNQWAEATWRTVALETAGSGSETAARGASDKWLKGLGAAANHYVVVDGSGLSRHGYVTPALMVRVLASVRAGPRWALFKESLPVMGVDGTLASRGRGTALVGNVRAKTGTVDKARNLTGVLQLGGGRELLFSILANNFTATTRDVDRAAELILLRARQLGSVVQ
ncbi:MAG: D-alanyl-D-alanine carboxypeptidase/D-alanyl-D-alanine-endopeptidase [Gemmatimonadaceae bacterium]|jgi:D-alanyl-D-alanine carboxypeptidase/D-alanyl-D-alanine-endopeptidase (penicillin-binding protein 4)|nr:D-alanyl-D-alanine carboxypeptidase/D-alanyl-D-alanine-endopeptidase [Gemmatimonadaceae bacterium]